MGSFFRYMDTVGDGSGTKNFNGEYAAAQGVALIAPPAGLTFSVARLLVSVEDTTGFTAQEYGNLGAALTNGIEIKHIDENGVKNDITDGVPVKSNAEWGRLCYDVDVKSWGQGNELLVARFTFEKAGKPIRLTRDRGSFLAVYLNDDFDGLISHYFMLQGVSSF